MLLQISQSHQFAAFTTHQHFRDLYLQQAIMSGRGKGGKGLGKGGAKRHRKVLRDNIQGEHVHLAFLGSVVCHDSLSFTLFLCEFGCHSGLQCVLSLCRRHQIDMSLQS